LGDCHHRAFIAKLRELAKNIAVDIEGIADVQGYIGEFYDISRKTMNETVTPGEQFIIYGDKIKVAGDDPACGIYFESTRDSSERIKVKGDLADNTASRIIGIVPMLIAPREYRVIIVTQYSSGRLLKEPRTITSDFTVSID
jgi:hypothetical protein